MYFIIDFFNYIVFKSTKTIKVSQIAEFPKLDITNESFKSDIYIITRQLKSFDLDYFSKVSNITFSFSSDESSLFLVFFHVFLLFSFHVLRKK